jgi:ribosome-associated heat shock protein Hsp15
MSEDAGTVPEGVRLDKWLWAARFFKTRALALEAINGGKIEADGQRPKPSRLVRPGTRLTIHKGELEWRITVLGVSRQRRPAPEAEALYSEDPASRERRDALVRERRERGVMPVSPGRPTKRDRRRLEEFTRGGE